MNRLQELIEAVREEKLSKDALEAYHTEISYLDNLMRMEIAPIEKDEAKFMGTMEAGETVAKMKVLWKKSPAGQRQIELSHYLKVTPKLLQSIKTRLYSIY